MDEINLFLFIILAIISALWGIQISNESTLALKVKQALRLSHPYNSRLLAFGTFRFWWLLTGKFSIILMPFYSVLLLLLTVHHFLFELLDCSRCTSTWIFGFLLFFGMNLPLFYSVALAPLPIVIIYIIERLNYHEN